MIAPVMQVGSHMPHTCDRTHEPPRIAKRREVKTEGSEDRGRGKLEVEVEVTYGFRLCFETNSPNPKSSLTYTRERATFGLGSFA